MVGKKVRLSCAFLFYSSMIFTLGKKIAPCYHFVQLTLATCSVWHISVQVERENKNR